MRVPTGILVVLALVTGGGVAAASVTARPVLTLHGLAANDAFGLGLAAAGDLNSDGFDDFVIGAANADGVFGDVGRAYAFLGGVHLDSIADAVVIGRTPSGFAGKSLAAIGDVNGDGYDDWLVASPNYDTGTMPRFPGKIWLHLGAAALDGSNDKTFDTPRPGSLGFYGTGVAGVGDFDGDGAPDFAIGGLLGSADSISAYVYRGGVVLDNFVDIPLHMPPGWSTRAIAAGDVNGDGWSDVVVGSSGIPTGGRIFVFFGGPGADGEPDVVLASGVTDIDLFGWSLADGDVNGDGRADILTGAAGRYTARGYATGWGSRSRSPATWTATATPISSSRRPTPTVRPASTPEGSTSSSVAPRSISIPTSSSTERRPAISSVPASAVPAIPIAAGARRSSWARPPTAVTGRVRVRPRSIASPATESSSPARARTGPRRGARRCAGPAPTRPISTCRSTAVPRGSGSRPASGVPPKTPGRSRCPTS